jgi:hypothetical protein
MSSLHIQFPDDFEICGKCAGTGTLMKTNVYGIPKRKHCDKCSGSGSLRKPKYFRDFLEHSSVTSEQQSTLDENIPLSIEAEYNRAVTEAEGIKQDLLTWISSSDRFTPIGGFDLCLSRYQNELWDWILNIDPASPDSAARVNTYICEADWLEGWSLGSLKEKLRVFAFACESVNSWRDIKDKL